MSEELWVVRAGEKAKYVGAFEANAYIAIGFSEMAADDLSLTDEQAVKARVTSPAERTYGSAHRLRLQDVGG